MTLVQAYLVDHSPSELYEEHGVKLHISPTRPYKASLNYDALEAKDSDPLAQQCRGLVLGTYNGAELREDTVVGNTVVLARPFDRFFNLGQEDAKPVDLSSNATRVFEKADGTLIISYFDSLCKEWHVATRAVCEADVSIDNWENGGTFRTLFEQALSRHLGMSFDYLTSRMDPERTYMFELCTPLNQIVVQHDDFTITLLGCRETRTGKEHWVDDIASHLGVPAVGKHSFGSVEEMLNVVATRDPRKYEGVVACDENFNRVKIKSAQYLAMSRLKDAVSSPRNVMTLILGDNLDDAIPVMSDVIKNASLEMKEGFRILCHEYPKQYAQTLAAVNESFPDLEHGSREHRKAFAQLAQKSIQMFHVAMKEYQGHCEGIRSYISTLKTGPKGSLPYSTLDGLIKNSMQALKKMQ